MTAEQEKVEALERSCGELRADAEDLRDVLLRNGFRKCDVPACNCGSWHQVDGWPARFYEIEEAMGGHTGEVLLGRVVAMRDRLAEAVALLAESMAASDFATKSLALHDERADYESHYEGDKDDLSTRWQRVLQAEREFDISLAAYRALLAEPVHDADWCGRRDAFLGRVRT